MGKVRKNSKKQKNDPLHKPISNNKKSKKICLHGEENSILDSKISGKILSSARKQQIENSDKLTDIDLNIKNYSLQCGSIFDKRELEIENINEEELLNELKINLEDKQDIESFQCERSKTRNLSDLILEKIVEKQNDVHVKLSDIESLHIEEIDNSVRNMYEGVRDVMKRYRSGKVPKAFKIIPKLKNWEQILFITEPHKWSAAAMFQGTRIFSSVLSQGMTQRFYNLVLLPRIRDDLSEYSHLNVHLYNSLTKALFKPAAFMKGIILPLLEAGDCTLREAIIFGSVISRNTIPVLHSSACLLKICEMEYTGANSVFIRIFLEKRYALPYRVIDAAVFHFLRFSLNKNTMPVLWHQSLLSFIERYKNDISTEQKEALQALLRNQQHPKITPAIRKEIIAAKCRDFVATGNLNDIQFHDPNFTMDDMNIT